MFRTPFPTSLKQEFRGQSLIQVISQRERDGTFRREAEGEPWDQPFPKLCSLLGAGKSSSFCGSLPSALPIPESGGFGNGSKHPEKKYFGTHLLDKTDPGGFVVSSGAAQVSSALLSQKTGNGGQEKGEVVGRRRIPSRATEKYWDENSCVILACK